MKISGATALLTLVFFGSAFSQTKDILDYNENLQIVTNSNSLLTGEDLLVALLGTSNTGIFLSEYSYIHLINDSGEIELEIAVEMEGGYGSASIFLPSSLNTGNYKLLAYTKWMLNKRTPLPSQYLISIFNPFKSFSSKNPDTNTTMKNLIDTNTYKSGSKDSSFFKTLKQFELNKTAEHSDSEDNPSYVPDDNHRESKNSKAEMNANAYSARVVNYSIRDTVHIIPDELFELPTNIRYAVVSIRAVDFHSESQKTDTLSKEEFDLKYLPDWRGLILSGVSRKPKSRIFIINEKQQYFSTISSDSSGNFNLPILNVDNLSNTYILSEEDDEVKLQSIDVSSLVQKPGSLYISSKLRDEIERRSFLVQYENIYKELIGEEKFDRKPFYGDRSSSYILSNYNSFNTLELVFREIIEGVKYRINSPTSLMVADNEMRYFKISPLVMFNSTPVRDIERLMNIRPELVERIEVVRKEILFNDTFFGGIVNIISGIEDYPSDFKKIKIGISNGDFPRVEFGRPKNELDFRLQLFWSRIDQFDNALKFSASDVVGTYEIKMVGVTSNGEFFTEKKHFNIEI